MYQIEIKDENNSKVFEFHGPIDSNVTDEIGAFVYSKIGSDDKVIFDMNDVSYMSSAGLRVVLKTAKSVKGFSVINVCPELYNIFDMVGFTQMLKIEKAKRILSIEGKELIGEGYMGKVYRLDPDTIIKVFKWGVDLKDVEREIGLAKKAFVLGVPTAIPFDIVKVKEGGYGSVFELLKSNSFNKLFINNPEKEDEYVKMYVDVIKTITSIKAPDPNAFPHKINTAYEWVDYLKEAKAYDEVTLNKLEKLVHTIPDEDGLIHGDCHIKNIMMQGDEPFLIDMDTLGVGHPIFELTAIFLTYIGYPDTFPGNVEEFLGISEKLAKKLFYSVIDELYKDRSESERKEIVEKCALLGYMWLTQKTLFFEPNNTVRLENAKEKVLSLIDKYETLAF